MELINSIQIFLIKMEYGEKMRHKKNRSFQKVSIPSGTLLYTGSEKIENSIITIIDYDKESFSEKEVKSFGECIEYIDKDSVTWINVTGLSDIKTIEEIGNYFDIHSLVLEDILDVGIRPKMEDLGRYLLFILKMIRYESEKSHMESEQISMIFGKSFVLTFHERTGDVFEELRNRIRNSRGRVRNHGSDYLSYAIIDAIVDNYFLVLEGLGNEIEELEDNLIEDPSLMANQLIHRYKRETLFLRKYIWPLREMISNLSKEKSELVRAETIIFFRDVYDHTIQIMDSIESLRDIIAGIQDLYFTSLSNRMNEIMKFLTIISTIFIPLTFIEGLYGMNFKYMPELDWKFSYPMALFVMIILVYGMVKFFKRKGWL